MMIVFSRNALARAVTMPQCLCLIFFLLFTTMVCCAHQITIIIDPAGDANHALREIDDTYERGLTLQCAQALKKKLKRCIQIFVLC